MRGGGGEDRDCINNEIAADKVTVQNEIRAADDECRYVDLLLFHCYLREDYHIVKC